MSKNITKFLRERVLPWLSKNTSTAGALANVDPKQFWIIPIAKSDPSYPEVEKQLLARFRGSTVLDETKADHYRLRLIDDCGTRCLLICKTDGTSINNTEYAPFGFEGATPTFLQRLEFIIDNDISSPSPIPPRIITGTTNGKDPIFEADLEPYLPKILSWAIPVSSEFNGDSANVIYTRAIINIEQSESAPQDFAKLLIELALSLPTSSHQWLFDQLYFSLTSRKPEYLYLGLYQLLEFFFPLKGISSLKSAIGFGGSILELRKFCSDKLGWNVNHQFGARAAAQYGSMSFATVCLGRDLDAEATPEKIDGFKTEAITKIADLRHRIAHQNFAAAPVATGEIKIKTEALIVLLIDAFAAYSKMQ